MDIGIDVIEFARISKLPTNTPSRVLSSSELKQYEAFTNERRKLEYLAGRISLKEAYIKAFNYKKLIYNELSFINNSDGKIEVFHKDKLLDNLKVSLSHSENYCIAIVLKLF